MFADPAIEGSTAEDEWEFSQEEVEGTAMHRLNDETRKIMFQSDLEGASEDKFFDDLLQGAYTEAEEIPANTDNPRSEEHTSELQSRIDLVCRLLLEKKNI